MSNFDNVYCPNCGSNNVKIIVEKEKEDFDLCGGITGAVCLGPIGLLCGFCCADGVKKRTTCVCNNCGRRFKL